MFRFRKPKHTTGHYAKNRLASHRRRIFRCEPLEQRTLLTASPFPGNPAPPELNLSAVSPQTIVGEAVFELDLLASGAVVSDDGLTGTAGVHFQLDPDETPAGATITANGVFRWTPSLDQIGDHNIIVIAIDNDVPPLADAEIIRFHVRDPRDNPPVVDLNGLDDGVDYFAQYVEDDGPVSIAAASLSIVEDSGLLTGLTVTLTMADDIVIAGAGLDDEETLYYDTSGTNISAELRIAETLVVGQSFLTLRFSGADTVAHYEQVLRSVQYANNSQDPTPGERQIEVTVDDGYSNSGLATTTVDITVVNDGPNLELPAGIRGPSLVAIRFGEELTFTAQATDPDSQAAEGELVFWLDLDNSGLLEADAQPEVSNPEGLFSWTPSRAGQYVIHVLATDQDGATDSERFTVNVTAVADSVLLSDGTLRILGTSLNDVTAVTLDGDNVVVHSVVEDFDYTTAFSAADIALIHYSGGRGSDVFMNATALRMFADGGDGDDLLYGGDGDEEIHGGGGNDIIEGGAGNDTLLAEDGNDQLFGKSGDDTLNGGSGNDYLEGQEGDDQLEGAAGDDVLIGGAGDDRLEGGGDNDQLIGEQDAASPLNTGDRLLDSDGLNGFTGVDHAMSFGVPGTEYEGGFGLTGFGEHLDFDINFIDKPIQAWTWGQMDAVEAAANHWSRFLFASYPGETVEFDIFWDTTLRSDTLQSTSQSAVTVGFTAYSMSLANHIEQRKAFGGSEFEIRLNPTYDWDIRAGTGMNPDPGSTYDAVPVLIHEIGHGLGFSKYVPDPDIDHGDPLVIHRYERSGGSISDILMGKPETVTRRTEVIWNSFVRQLEDRGAFNQPLTALNQADRHTAVTSGDLFWTGANGNKFAQDAVGQDVELFAPADYNDGASISHLDDNRATGAFDGFIMGHDAAPMPAIQRLSRVELGMMQDLGWDIDYTPFVSDESFWVLTASDSRGVIVDKAYSNFGGGLGELPLSGDWNGDGITDIGVYRPHQDGKWVLAVLNSHGQVTDRRRPDFGGAPDEVPLVGDWDADGRDDIGVYRPNRGTTHWRLARLNTDGSVHDILSPNAGGGAGELPLVGDWDGDGITDVGIYRPARATDKWVLRVIDDDGQIVDTRLPDFGGGIDEMPLVGNWDGNGSDDIGVYRPNHSTPWRLARLDSGDGSVRATISPAAGGGSGEQPILGDWNGDGITDVGIYRPARTDDKWVLRVINSGGQVIDTRRPDFGGGVDEPPIIGDWDGDGDADVAVYRPTIASLDAAVVLKNSEALGVQSNTDIVAIEGDVDLDGKVDSRDYVALQHGFGMMADAADGVNRPFDVAVDIATGNVFVANLDARTIQKFTQAGVGSLLADATEGLKRPFDVAISGVPLPPAAPPPPSAPFVAQSQLAAPTLGDSSGAKSVGASATAASAADAALSDAAVNWLAYYFWEQLDDE